MTLENRPTTASRSSARSQGLRYQELLDSDTREVPDVLRLESERDLPVVRVPIEQYISREFHDLEVEKVWKRVWQFACREEERLELRLGQEFHFP